MKKSNLTLIFITILLFILVVISILIFNDLGQKSKTTGSLETSAHDEISESSENDSSNANTDKPGSDTSTDTDSEQDVILPDISLSVQTFEKSFTTKEGTVGYNITVDKPSVVYAGNTAVQDTINSQLTTAFDKITSDALTFAEFEMQSWNDTMQPTQFTIVCTMELSAEIVTIKATDLSNGTVTGYHFRLSDGSSVTLNDITADMSGLKAAAVVFASDMKDTLEGSYSTYITSNLCDDWYISKRNLVLLYQPGKIAPATMGVIEIEIPSSSLSGILNINFG